jgi:hypothetical protein
VTLAIYHSTVICDGTGGDVDTGTLCCESSVAYEY